MQYSESAYNALLDRIFKLSPSVQSTGFAGGAYKPGLEAMESFCTRLGNPHRKFRCIHVAGTNGKGSVSSMIASALSAKGYKVGLYTSPHLVDFRERVKVIDPYSRAADIPRSAVWEFFQSFDVTGLSFFEITTGLCFWWFANQQVDYAVIEVGLGGRLDSTNVITPQLSIITSIGLDHCALLGNTRAEIAAEKAGIFKAGVPALVGFRDDETAPVFEKEAARVGAKLFFTEKEAFQERITRILPKMDLRGDYQSRNLSTVLKAMEILGTEATDKALTDTASITCFHGRWERLSDNPLTIADIGHNPAALKLNFAQLTSYGKSLHIVYGIMADKDLDSIIPMMPSDAQYYLCAPDSARSLPSNILKQRILSVRGELVCESYGSVADAVRAAHATATPDSIIYIGGSSFVVSEALTLK